MRVSNEVLKKHVWEDLGNGVMQCIACHLTITDNTVWLAVVPCIDLSVDADL